MALVMTKSERKPSATAKKADFFVSVKKGRMHTKHRRISGAGDAFAAARKGITDDARRKQTSAEMPRK